MGLVPVLCIPSGEAKVVSAALQRAGVRSPLWSVRKKGDAAPLPDGDAYVVVDRVGLPVAHHLAAIAPDKSLLKKVIAFAPRVPPRDLAALDRLGIRYYCNASAGFDQLLKLIGQIKADILLSAKERVTDAADLALTVFEDTASALDAFSSDQPYHPTFYRGLADTYASKVRDTSLFLLVAAISENQDTTIQHCSLVTILATALASSIGFSATDMERVFMAAFFHDIGKSAIPKSVIDKPDKLTDEEMQLMRTHVTVGYEMLRRFPETAGELAEVALSHHEYLDGSGYPNGLRAPQIPDLVRLVTIADIYAALIERRAYKPPFPHDKAFSILRGMGGKLDQDLVTLFQPVAEQAGALK